MATGTTLLRCPCQYSTGSNSVTPIAALAGALRDQATQNAAASLAGIGPDLFVLELAEKLQDGAERVSGKNGQEALQKLRDEAADVALSKKWPTTRVEEYRFTDLKALRATSLEVAPALEKGVVEDAATHLAKHSLPEADACRLVFVDGIYVPELSAVQDLPGSVVVGSIRTLSGEEVSQHVAPHLGAPTGKLTAQLDLFAALNGVGAADVGVVAVPAGVKLEAPVHVLYYSTGSAQAGSARVSSPRLLVVAGEGAEVVEEYLGGGGCFVNSVAEFVVAKRARVVHSYLQQQARDAFHIRTTAVAQDEESTYTMVEAGLGGRLSRHNFRLEQLGPDTVTELSTFSLAGQRQLQDLHSSLELSHPRGQTRQLHKCIVTDSTGHAVFDGNVRVNRYAQQTDAGQLSRSLLLKSRGTINVKPNLQIVADDVKCTHGAAISDLEDEQLFYFRARGIDETMARSALVFSFSAEVIEKLPYDSLKKRVESTIKGALAAEGAMDSSVLRD
eukprot:jgi/Mesen1/9132/ME000058S08633